MHDDKFVEYTANMFTSSIPGQSINLIFLSKITSCDTLVNPGIELTPTARDRNNELINELLPTFGNPI